MPSPTENSTRPSQEVISGTQSTQSTPIQSSHPLKILAIESSCDDTAAAVVSDGRKALSSVVASQVFRHVEFGGVVPEIAGRMHCEAISGVVREALTQADTDLGVL